MSPDYVQFNNTRTLYRIDGTSVTQSSATYGNHCESAIAVSGDARSIDHDLLSLDAQYTLNTPHIGATYPWPASFGQSLQYRFVDGATNGARNFSSAGTQDANFNDAGVAVYPFDRAWQGPVALFGLSSAYTVNGVAFNPSNNSLWLQGASQFDTGTSHFVADDTMDGTLRSSCDDSSLDGFGGHALAMRDADGTLWSIYGPGSKFGQWSTTGTFLQSLNSDAFAGGLSTASGVRFRAGSRSGGADSFRRRTGSIWDDTLSPAPLRDGLVHAINTGVRTLG